MRRTRDFAWPTRAGLVCQMTPLPFSPVRTSTSTITGLGPRNNRARAVPLSRTVPSGFLVQTVRGCLTDCIVPPSRFHKEAERLSDSRHAATEPASRSLMVLPISMNSPSTGRLVDEMGNPEFLEQNLVPAGTGRTPDAHRNPIEVSGAADLSQNVFAGVFRQVQVQQDQVWNGPIRVGSLPADECEGFGPLNR